MREKKPALVVTFDTTMGALQTEEYCAKHDIPGRLIPVPPQKTAGCGLAWKTEPDLRDALEQELKGAGIPFKEFDILEI